MSESKSVLEFLGAKKSFGLGFASALIVMIVIGFVMQVSGSGFSLGAKKTTTFGGTNTGTQGTGSDTGSDTGVATSITLNPITSDDHLIGDLETAQVVMVEFSDYDCPFCSSFHPTLQRVKDEYGDQVAWVYRHFPLDSLHPEARTKAEASECVAELGGDDAFWAFTDIMFDSSRSISAAQLGTIAAEVGVSQSDFETCMTENRYSDEVQKDYQDAVASTGRGTPHTVIVSADGTKVPLSGAVPFEQVKSTIDSMLQ